MDSWQTDYFVNDSTTDRYQAFLFERWTGLLLFPIVKKYEIRIIAIMANYRPNESENFFFG